MFFNSIEFLIFFVIVFTLYYLLPHRGQNRMLLVASYVFYGWWDWRFLFLIFISTVVDYICGIQIAATSDVVRKKRFLFASITVNLSLLGFFKYWNFFTESLVNMASTAGIQLSFPVLHIILPVGISFYTFQTMTYTVDVYRGELDPSENFWDFALFVSFFPQLVAGPIERAKALLPQIEGKRRFKSGQFLDGLHLIFWGLFKKMFVADNLGVLVDRYYGATDATGAQYILATIAFAFQIYGDFSGYSDIARGTAKCMGIELMVNFKQPYLAVNPSDLWRRWHISLSTWLRDYLYISLGGNRHGTWQTYRNLMLTMLLGGLWHGAAWNFVLWGAYHGALLCAYRRLGRSTPHSSSLSFSTSTILAQAVNVTVMFTFTCGSWVLFRAQNFAQITLIVRRIFTGPWQFADSIGILKQILFFTAVLLLIMLYDFMRQFTFSRGTLDSLAQAVMTSPHMIFLKSTGYGVLTYLLFLYATKAQSFIYFQF